MPCYKPLKGYKDPVSGGLVFTKTSTPLQVACGSCFGCRLDRVRVWAMRITHEASMHIDFHGNCFVTLTYRDRSECTPEQLRNQYHVPADYSLNKRHFQDFMRRLRREFPQKIRFFHCGEYGEQTLRPHYHACLFNCDFADQVVFRETEGIFTYSSPTLERLWPYGFATVGELNYDTAAYTAAYVLKKVTGKKADDEYLRNDAYGVAYWVRAPYVTMSLGRKKPGGIGASFYEKYSSDFEQDECPVPGRGVFKKLPRYYETILADENPASLERIKELRQAFLANHKHDFTPERLEDKYKCARARYSKTRELQ